MFKILVVDSGAIDRDMIEEVLLEHLRGAVEVYQAVSTEEASAIMEEQEIDLLIADVPLTTAYVKNLVRTAYSLRRDIHVILTTVKAGGEIAQLANRLDVTGYLLKPFRRETLLEKVRPLALAAQDNTASSVENELEACMSIISNSIQDCQYKKTVEAAKSYLDFLYQAEGNMSVVRTKAVAFLEQVSELGKIQNPDTRRRMEGCLERFRSRFDLQGSRFQAISVMEKMLDLIFADMENKQLYSEDTMKKVLNYIDRNIKKGITLDSAAEYANMSSSYFSKFFKRFTGVNFITYVTDWKMECAKDLLENTDMPVINIAYEVSYRETNYFCKAFKKKVGVTPTEYREKCVGRGKTDAHTMGYTSKGTYLRS